MKSFLPKYDIVIKLFAWSFTFCLTMSVKQLFFFRNATPRGKMFAKVFVSSGLLKHQQRYQQLQKFIVLDRGFAKKLDFMIILLF